MATAAQRPKFVVIVGPTASGKSELSIRIAREFDGEIICADSRTVYKGMDIGTAKPSKADQTEIRHWGLDLVEPGQRFTAYQFKEYAKQAIKDIKNRGKLPILVGGAGLYIDGLLFDFDFLPGYDPGRREKLEKLSVEESQGIIQKKGYQMPQNKQNKRHLIRTIESNGRPSSRRPGPEMGVLLVGLLSADKILRQRINNRAEAIFAAGVIEETRKLLKKYGEELIKKTAGIVYKICLDVINGKLDGSKAVERFKTADWQYARRQKTWFKRNKFIRWFDSSEQAYSYIKMQLNN